MGLTLSHNDLTRYSRQIILPHVGLAGQQQLARARVLVVGAGGLGSAVLAYLAAAGVASQSPGLLGIAEGDDVDLSNLQRQVLYTTADIGKSKAGMAAEALQALNPELRVRLEPHLTADNAVATLQAYDLVIDGSDTWTSRNIVNQASVLTSTPLVYGAAEQWSGQVSIFNLTPESACFRCAFPDAPTESTSCAEVGVLGAVTGVIGSVMASEAVKLILNRQSRRQQTMNKQAPEDNALSLLDSTLWHWDGLNQDTIKIKLAKRADCEVCGQHQLHSV
ncbi:MAG: HesA/MoeB/ThiF family protein [Deinococcota bacterium]